jgi:hypothetical protein
MSRRAVRFGYQAVRATALLGSYASKLASLPAMLKVQRLRRYDLKGKNET